MDLSAGNPSASPLILQSMTSSAQESSGAFTIHHLDDCKYLFNGVSNRHDLHLYEHEILRMLLSLELP